MGIIQVNKYQSLGFYKTYFLVILLDDGRKAGTPNTILWSSKHEHIHKIGIVFVKITQPTGSHFDNRAGVGICVDKQATPLDQTIQMTNKVKELLKFS